MRQLIEHGERTWIWNEKKPGLSAYFSKGEY